jgi:hypothetical protein
MQHQKHLKYLGFCLVVSLLSGCQHAARDTTGFALEDTVTVEASFDDTWQAVKTVLLESDLEIYTRDRRGTFVAYSKMRHRFYQPARTKYTVELARVSEEQTLVYCESLRQKYGVTLLTYPDWHDRKTKDVSHTLAILESLQAKLAE